MNLKTNNFFCFIFLFLSCLINQCLADTLGSNYTLQSHIVFDYGEDNKIHNDAKMENGFTLTARTEAISDVVASCSFDSYFPVTGFTSLNGGSLYLNNNLKFDNIYSLVSAGKIYGNNYLIMFPEVEDISGIPSSIDRGGRLTFIDDVDITDDVVSVDWSYDDKYIGIGSLADRLQIRSFNGSTISDEIAGVDVGNDVISVRWHPNSYYIAIAIGGTSSDNIRVYSFDSSAGSLTQTDVESFGEAVNACAWSWDGKYLVVVTGVSTVRLYSFSQGSLTYLDAASYYGNGTAQNDCLDCSPNSYDLVFGTTSEGADILVYNFDSSSLNVTTSIHIPGITSVKSVSWKQEDNLIAAGISGSTKPLRVYELFANTLTEKATASDLVSFYHVDWAKSGNRLAVAKNLAPTYEVEVYYFDKNSNNLNLIDGYVNNVVHEAVKFSHSGKYIATGNQSDDCTVYKFNQNYMLFDNTNLIFNSDAEFIVTTTFSGTCTINGKGNKVYLKEDGSIKVASEGQLKLQNLELIGLEKTNLQCLANDASIILEDCKLTVTSDYTFGTGSILFKGDNVISGTNKFIYSVVKSSTIDSNSTLYIDNGITFDYDPSVVNRDLLYMEDNTSWLFLNGCTLNSTKTGMRLTRGKLFIDNLVTFNAEGSAISEAICFGNKNYATSDLEINILAGANLEIYGRLEYENIN